MEKAMTLMKEKLVMMAPMLMARKKGPVRQPLASRSQSKPRIRKSRSRARLRSRHQSLTLWARSKKLV